jgi:hypothetical protein
MSFSGWRSIPPGATLLAAVVTNSPGQFWFALRNRTRAAGFPYNLVGHTRVSPRAPDRTKPMSPPLGDNRLDW